MTDKKFTWIKVVAAAVIGALLAILLTECLGLTGSRGEAFMARRMGHEKLAVYIEKQQESVDAMNDLNEAYELSLIHILWLKYREVSNNENKKKD